MPEPTRVPSNIDILVTGQRVARERTPIDKIRTWHITLLAESLVLHAPPSTEWDGTPNTQSNYYQRLAVSLIADQLKSVAWRSTILGIAFGGTKDLCWINQGDLSNLAESIAETARRYLRWTEDSEDRHYRRCMVSMGIVWCCQVLEYERSLDDPERFPRLDAEATRSAGSVR